MAPALPVGERQALKRHRCRAETERSKRSIRTGECQPNRKRPGGLEIRGQATSLRGLEIVGIQDVHLRTAQVPPAERPRWVRPAAFRVGSTTPYTPSCRRWAPAIRPGSSCRTSRSSRRSGGGSAVLDEILVGCGLKGWKLSIKNSPGRA